MTRMTKPIENDPLETAIDDLPRARKIGDTAEAIAQIVKSLPKGTHLTAPEVFERAREIGMDLSLSTVYRTLHKMKKHGDVMTVSGERGLRYEIAEEGEDHDHLICLGCGLTIEFHDDLIRGFGKTVAHRKGFEHRSSRFDILGYCQTCRSSDQLHRINQTMESLNTVADVMQELIPLLRQSTENLQLRKMSKAQATLSVVVDQLRQSLDDAETALSQIESNYRP